MPKYVAFLRAINVGGHMVRMERLRELFVKMKFGNVETFINSGNVIFDSPAKNTAALEKKIEQTLEKALGYPVATYLRTPAELVAVTHHKPFSERELKADGNLLYVSFLANSPDDDACTRLMKLRSPVHDFHVHGREVYFLRRTKVGESDYSGAKMEKALGCQSTMRNLNTVERLAKKYAR